MVRMSGTSPAYLVDLVCFVYLVHLVYPVSLVQPNTQDKPNKPIKRDRLAELFSILFEHEAFLSCCKQVQWKAQPLEERGATFHR
jgi:hypothetical protein